MKFNFMVLFPKRKNRRVNPEKGVTILFFATDVTRQSGASYGLRETVRRVAAQGVKPVVVIPDSDESREMFPQNEFDVVYLKMQRVRRTLNVLTQVKYLLFFLPTIGFLRRTIRRKQVDILHFNEIYDFVGGIAARLSRIPSVCHVRADGLPNPWRRLFLSILQRVADAIVVPSKSTGTWMTAEAKTLETKIVLIPDYAFDISPYDPLLLGAAFREEIGVPSNATLVVFVSKFVIHKGHLCFIRAAELVLRNTKQLSKPIRFVVVGGEVSGHELDARTIKGLARETCPELQFVGERSDLPNIYAASDIVVHCPVLPDPYPTVVLLAMLMAKPVIGSAIGGIPEQIEHNVTGLLVPPDDSTALAEAIVRLAQNQDQAAALGLAGMTWVRKEFAPEQQAQMLMDVYKTVLSAHKNLESSTSIITDNEQDRSQ